MSARRGRRGKAARERPPRRTLLGRVWKAIELVSTVAFLFNVAAWVYSDAITRLETTFEPMSRDEPFPGVLRVENASTKQSIHEVALAMMEIPSLETARHIVFQDAGVIYQSPDVVRTLLPKHWIETTVTLDEIALPDDRIVRADVKLVVSYRPWFQEKPVLREILRFLRFTKTLHLVGKRAPDGGWRWRVT